MCFLGDLRSFLSFPLISQIYAKSLCFSHNVSAQADELRPHFVESTHLCGGLARGRWGGMNLHTVKRARNAKLICSGDRCQEGMEYWPCHQWLVHLKVLFMNFLVATFARVLFLKPILLANVYSCHILCFQRTDWRKQLSLYIWQKMFPVTDKPPLLIYSTTCFCLCSEGATIYDRALCWWPACLVTVVCQLPASVPPNLHTCLHVFAHQSISFFFYLCQKATLEEINPTSFHLTF